MQTIAFYSYKGGVGRSLALANFGRLLAQYLGKKVFAIDLDLEAPGLQYKLLTPEERGKIRHGVVDYLHRFLTEGKTGALEDYVVPVEHEPGRTGLMHLMPAGRAPAAGYWRRLGDIFWREFLYAEGAPGIPLFFDLKKQIRERYEPDYLLIDSRTGITEIGGVATTVLADQVICLVAHNDENLEGARAVLRSLCQSPRLPGQEVIEIVPVVTRLPARLSDEVEGGLVEQVRTFLNEPAEDTGDALAVEEVFVLHSEPRLQVREEILIGSPTGTDAALLRDYLRLFRHILPRVAEEEGFARLERHVENERINLWVEAARQAEAAARSSPMEAVALYRKLAAKRPEEFLPHLAASLRSLAAWQSAQGQWEGAMVSDLEALEIWRKLAVDYPEAFMADLARNLTSLGNCQSALGQREAALASDTEAMEVWRKLAAEDPQAYLPNFARSLNNLGLGQRDLGQREAALVSVKEAVELWRKLAAEDPGDFLPELARSLNNLGNCQRDLGQREAALVSIREAVELWNKLAAERPEVFQPDLAGSLNNLGNCQSELGQREAALVSAQKAVALYRRLAVKRPAAFLPNLASSLNNLGVSQRGLGQREAALSSSREAVEIWRRLASERPEAFLPDLASSVSNLGIGQSDLGQREAALTSALEAVALYRKLALERPEAFLPNLASSLNNLGNRQSELGQREAALASVKEALERIWPFYTVLPRAWERLTRMILENLRDHLKALGRPPSPDLRERFSLFEGKHVA